MLATKQQAKKHAYDIAAEHLLSLIEAVEANSKRESEDADYRKSEGRLAEALKEVRAGLAHRSKQMKVTHRASA